MNLLHLPLLAPGLLFLAAAIAASGPGLRPVFVIRLVQGLSLLSIAVALASALTLWSSGPSTSGLLGIGGLGISVRLDVVSVSLLSLVSLIGWIVLRYSANYLDGEQRQGQFLAWMAGTLGAVLLLVQSGNLGGFFLAWLMTGHCLQQLLLFYRDRIPAQRAARKKILFTRLGEVSLAIAFVLLWISFGTADIATLLDQASSAGPSAAVAWAMALIALSAALQSAQFPAHGWLVEVVETPTPVSALLHAGVVNGGGFLLIRFADLLMTSPGVLAVLVMIGGLSALVGALSMLAQPAIKNSLAWSTVAQMGFMIMQCGLGLFALALLHILAHSLYKAHAFLMSGMAVDTVAANRRPGPVAVPNVRAVIKAFGLALAVYAAVAMIFSLISPDKSVQALVLGAVLVFGVAYLIAQGLADAAPREITRRTLLYSMAVSVSYFALQTLSEALTASTLPPTPSPGPLEWGLLSLLVASFGLVAFIQALFPNWAQHPAAAGLRIHLANGLYANALIDRALGNWSIRPRVRKTVYSPLEDHGAPASKSAQAVAPDECEKAAEQAVRQIPPLWPLDATVAVNPFLGQAGETLAETQARLARVGGVAVTMPRAWYRERVDAGLMTEQDLAEALEAGGRDGSGLSVSDLMDAMNKERSVAKPLPTVAELAAQQSGTDWPAIISERFAVWAGAWFDRGQALWSAPRARGAWAEFRAFATHDLGPEIAGLEHFAQFVADAPDDPVRSIVNSTRRLGLSSRALPTYYHQLLHSLGGWGQSARYLHFQAELAGEHDETPIAFLAIGLLWEEALFNQYEDSIRSHWEATACAHAQELVAGSEDQINELLQLAAERGAQRALFRQLSEPEAHEETAQHGRPVVQAAFCIDVRSERFRRALESLDSGIMTLGFAGFFGVSVEHRRFASDVPEARLPVLLTPDKKSVSGGSEHQCEDTRTRLRSRVGRAWGRFKFAAVSSFAFVESMGPVYLVKLVRDAFGSDSLESTQDPAPRLQPEPDSAAATDMAETILRAMSLTERFAPVVLLLGHGATVTNNPQASALHCGACGGYQGDANARLLAGLLNDPQARLGLAERGIKIPEDTVFVGGLHDTVTDRITLYDQDPGADAAQGRLSQICSWLDTAGALCRQERALTLPGSQSAEQVSERSRRWSEVRPEWALAGCRAFIAAPRCRTRNKDLGGSAFLHDYAWRDDQSNDFAVLELILTAPVVVASWINLQYYGSTVAPDHFGSGNKLLHNVVGGMGVYEGNPGILRGGLAWQSVHDGERFVHDPLRLTVCVEAPTSAIDDILARHEQVRTLFDRGWISLIVLDDAGRPSHRYVAHRQWVELEQLGAQA